MVNLFIKNFTETNNRLARVAPPPPPRPALSSVKRLARTLFHGRNGDHVPISLSLKGSVSIRVHQWLKMEQLFPYRAPTARYVGQGKKDSATDRRGCTLMGGPALQGEVPEHPCILRLGSATPDVPQANESTADYLTRGAIEAFLIF